jgi:hypothetical protein
VNINGWQPVFDGDLYRFHEQLVGFATTPAQKEVIDNYMKLTGFDRQAVAQAMLDTPNPRERGWLRRVGDLLKAQMLERLNGEGA